MSEATEIATIVETGVKERLEAAFKVLIEEADINPALVKLVEGFFTQFMNNTDEAALVAIMAQLRDQLIPYILGEENASTD